VSRLRPMSRRRQREQRARRDLIRALIEARGDRCELQVEGTCTGRVEGGHEILKRSRLGSILDPENVLLSCNPCNGWVEDNPDDAHARGLARHSWEPPAERPSGWLALVPLTIVITISASAPDADGLDVPTAAPAESWPAAAPTPQPQGAAATTFAGPAPVDAPDVGDAAGGEARRGPDLSRAPATPADRNQEVA